MAHWNTGVVAILLAGFPGAVSAQADCDTMRPGPARTDCYVGLSRLSRGQSDLAAGQARVQSDAARYRRITGTAHPKQKPHHRQ